MLRINSDIVNFVPKGRQLGNNKNTLKTLKKIFFSLTTELISTKLGTKHPWVKGIQVCTNELPRPFPRGANSNS